MPLGNLDYAVVSVSPNYISVTRTTGRGAALPTRAGTGRLNRARGTALVLGIAAVAVRLPVFINDRHLTFDDGVYGASAIAMRHGGVPFKEVFSSQGPLHLPLVWLADVVGFRQANSPRLLGLAAAIAMMVTVWGVVRTARGSRSLALVAALIVGFTGSVLWVSGPVASDAPALALATGCVWAALAYRRAPSSRLAIAMGLLAGLAASEKAMVIPCLVPCAFVMLEAVWQDRRRLVDIAVSAVVCLAAIFFVALPWGLSDVWDQSVAYHTEAAVQRTPGANMSKVVSTLFDRDLWLLAAVLGAVVSLVVGKRSASPSALPTSAGGSAASGVAGLERTTQGADASTGSATPRVGSELTPSPTAGSTGVPSKVGIEPAVLPVASPSDLSSASSSTSASLNFGRGTDGPASADGTATGRRTDLWGPDWVPVLAWLVSTVALLAWTHPLWRPHVAHLAPAIAILVALARPKVSFVLAALVAIAPLHVWRMADFLDPDPRTAAEIEARSYMDALPRGAWVIADEPGIPWRDGRRTTNDLVDTSILRIEAHRITSDSLAKAALEPQVCGFLIWRGTHFGSFPDLPAKLQANGYSLVADMAHGRSFWSRDNCSVTGS